jgi:hypothetical protein
VRRSSASEPCDNDAAARGLNRLRHERDTALTEIRIFVGNEVNATLGEQRRTEVADDARSAIVQIIALRTMADAIRERDAKIDKLRNKISNQENENASLRDAVARYRQFRLDYLRRDADCAQLRQKVLAWLKQSPGVTGRFSEK